MAAAICISSRQVATSASHYWAVPARVTCFWKSLNRYGSAANSRSLDSWSCPNTSTLLISEPGRATVPIMIQVLKQRVARRLLPRCASGAQGELWQAARRFWQRRYYDFNVYSDQKVTEKLQYMHWNPVKRGLIAAPELWRWSSYRTFAGLEEGVVKLNWQQRANGKQKQQDRRKAPQADSLPTLRKARRVGHPLLWFVNKRQNHRMLDEGRGTRLREGRVWSFVGWLLSCVLDRAAELQPLYR